MEGDERAGVPGLPDSAMPGRVQVVVRVRPSIASEEGAEISTRQASPTRVEVLLGSAPDAKQGLDMGQDRARVLGKGKAYDFDACVGAQASQEEMFEATRLSELVEQAIEGFNVTLFAYGQTGSGKTHTVVGPRFFGGAAPATIEPEDGLLPRAYRAAFASLERRMGDRPSTSFTAHLTCVEIYNEQVTDLMAPPPAGPAPAAKSLAVRHDKSKGFYVQDLTRHKVTDLASALAVVHAALVRRHVGSHRLNATSTRSHCIVTLHIDAEDTSALTAAPQPADRPASRRPSQAASEASAGDDAAPLPGRRFGKLVLVDLAGSERLKETGQSDESALWETGNINRSLFALGKVLSALSHRGRGSHPEAGFVPYRDSKLTQLLFDGLKGTGRVLMVACCGPTRNHIEETMNTLHFAQVALHIKSEPVVVLDPHDQLVVDLRSTIVQLKVENRKLAHALKDMADGKDFKDALRSLEGPELSGTLKNVLGVEGPPSPTARAGMLYRPKSMPSPDRWAALSPYGAAGLKGTARKARKTLVMPGERGGEASTSTALPPLRPRNAQKREKLQNLKKVNQQVWRAAKASNRSGPVAPPPGGPIQADGARAIDEFPELLALEYQFQARLAHARGLDGEDDEGVNTSLEEGGEASAVSVAKELSTVPEGHPMSPAHRAGGRAKASVASAAVAAEPKAVRWAEKNRWFGSDVELTAFAYELHDQLVELEGVDPNSDRYYDELDRRMATRFPDRLGPAAAAAAARIHSVALRAYTRGGGASDKDKAKHSPPPAVAPAPSSASMLINNPLAVARQQPKQAWNARLRSGGPEPLSPRPANAPPQGSAAALLNRRGSAGMAAGPKANHLKAGPGWAGVGASQAGPDLSWGVVPDRDREALAYRGGGAFGAKPPPGNTDYNSVARSRVQVMQELRMLRDEAEAERRRLMEALGSRLAHASGQGGWIS